MTLAQIFIILLFTTSVCYAQPFHARIYENLNGTWYTWGDTELFGSIDCAITVSGNVYINDPDLYIDSTKATITATDNLYASDTAIITMSPTTRPNLPVFNILGKIYLNNTFLFDTQKRKLYWYDLYLASSPSVIDDKSVKYRVTTPTKVERV